MRPGQKFVNLQSTDLYLQHGWGSALLHSSRLTILAPISFRCPFRTLITHSLLRVTATVVPPVLSLPGFATRLIDAALTAANRKTRSPRISPVCLCSTVEQYQRALAAEIATIELIDEAVGEVLAAVEHAGDNTIVIFASDHGDMFGDHDHAEPSVYRQSLVRCSLLDQGLRKADRTASCRRSSGSDHLRTCGVRHLGDLGHGPHPILREPAAQSAITCSSKRISSLILRDSASHCGCARS